MQVHIRVSTKAEAEADREADREAEAEGDRQPQRQRQTGPPTPCPSSSPCPRWARDGAAARRWRPAVRRSQGCCDGGSCAVAAVLPPLPAGKHSTGHGGAPGERTELRQIEMAVEQ